jgi:hypothetical protein
MIVAWQFAAWERLEKAFRPVRDGLIRLRSSRYVKQSRARTDEIKPSLRDGLVFCVFQAVNCQATIIQSLRDKANPSLG